MQILGCAIEPLLLSSCRNKSSNDTHKQIHNGQIQCRPSNKYAIQGNKYGYIPVRRTTLEKTQEYPSLEEAYRILRKRRSSLS